jgi:hypothetical protein
VAPYAWPAALVNSELQRLNQCLTLRAREGQSVRTFLETAES